MLFLERELGVYSYQGNCKYLELSSTHLSSTGQSQQPHHRSAAAITSIFYMDELK